MQVSQVLTHPAFAYGLLTVAVGLCVYLFITAKQDLHRIHSAHAAAETRLVTALERVEADLASLRRSVGEVAIKASALPQMVAPKSGMNISRRAQVLRMHKRGEQPEQIAAALGVAFNEVELLLKLSRDAMTPVAAAGS